MNEGITRAELARITGFSKSTISQHVEKLKNSGFVVDANDEINKPNRKSLYLKFNKNCSYVICIDLGATSLNVAVCNLMGEPLASSFNEGIDINVGPRVLLPRALSIIQTLISEAGITKEKILGIGMGIPSPIEFSTGRPIAPPIMQGGWADFPVKDYLQNALGRQAFVDNDVNLMVMAEHETGLANGLQNFIFVKLGTGIGCGIYCGGRIYRGSNGCAGDIGHIRVDGCDVLCTCGNRGCLERLAGGTAIARHAVSLAKSGESAYLAMCLKNGREIDCKTVKDAILAQDEPCIEYIQKIGTYIGETLAKAVNFYNPSMVVLGGGLTNFGDILFTPIREVIYRCSSALATRNLIIQRSSLGEIAGIIGATVMVRDGMFSPREFTRMLHDGIIQV
jgi:glucokinase-like ROK family protein